MIFHKLVEKFFQAQTPRKVIKIFTGKMVINKKISIFAKITGNMNHEIIQKISNYLIGKPVNKAWIFGSVSRGEETADSDIDLLVEFDPAAEVDLFDHVVMMQDLEELLGHVVDIVSEGTLFPWVRKYVDKDKILIYERKTA